MYFLLSLIFFQINKQWMNETFEIKRLLYNLTINIWGNVLTYGRLWNIVLGNGGLWNKKRLRTTGLRGLSWIWLPLTTSLTPHPQGGTLEARMSRGILEVLGLEGARKALNWTEPVEKASWAGPAETKESWAGPAGEQTLRAPGTERALERTLRAPGTERALERTLRAPGTERALEDVVSGNQIHDRDTHFMYSYCLSASCWILGV